MEVVDNALRTQFERCFGPTSTARDGIRLAAAITAEEPG
jgi:hypothetical protein